MKKAKRISLRRFVSLILSFIIALPALSTGVFAHNSENVIRVGWYESSFNMTDELGRRSGYAYEYQQKIAAYTGWTYEYIEGSWTDLMQMLSDGRIDLMSDISYTEERAENMLFSALPMGAEEYYLFVSPGNDEISSEDISTFDGKTVGVPKDSVLIDYLNDFTSSNGIAVKIIELTGTEGENQSMLVNGKIDMYMTISSFVDPDTAIPVCEVGSCDFFFAVSKSKHRILTELNSAMKRIREENRYYSQQLSAKYLQSKGVNLYLSADEKKWLSDHGTIRVGYQDNYLAFCAKDPETGELTGALKDYLEYASVCFENADISFEPVAYPTSAAAMEALKVGEVDCMFPANLTDYDGEVQGLLITPALMRTDMSAVIRESEKLTFYKKDRVTVAVNAGNPNYNMFLLDHFPDWRSIFFKDTDECLAAVADGKADCLLISVYRFNNIADFCDRNGLTTISTGVEMDYCFAVSRGSTSLYSILTKITGNVPSSAVNASLSYYFTEDAKIGFIDLIRQNLLLILAVIAVVILLIMLLIMKSSKSKKKAIESQELISATETDELTGLYNRSFFYEYAFRMYHDAPDKPMDAIVLNIDQFHSVNAINGRAFGDRVLRMISDEIRAFLIENGGIASRAEPDRFAVYTSRLEDHRSFFDRLQGMLNTMSANASIRLRMGVMPWQEGTEPHQQFEHALIACNLARDNYKEHLIVFDESVRKRESYEQRLRNDLNRALDKFEFEIHYQPKYDIQSDTPRLVGAEALVRWRHPELGMIPPGEFIPLFEKNGQVSAVDKYVWNETAKQVSLWRDEYGVTIPVSLNLSRVDIFDHTLESTVEGMVDKYGLDQSDISFEVTESAYTENAEHFIYVVKRLRSKGYRIEMDDFGTGYSSLNMLSTMPIDVLKMDRAFIRDIDRDEKDVQMVELILDIAKNLKVPVIAEGVETEEQYGLLKKLGCKFAQGFYFCRPLPAGEFEEKIIKNMTVNN
ncbi:MAG: EAL domain-containing protein [Clostridia bacterium]|nr:EAL domain-containing protein [Clostridia bacterium]